MWGQNTSTAVNARWATDVKAQFGGIPSGGDFDKNVKNEAQWTQFSEYVQWLISVQGGDKSQASNIVIFPDNFAAFKTWTETAGTNHSLLGFVVSELWALMKGSDSDVLRIAAKQVQDGFNYIVLNPQPYKTAVTFSIESDWCVTLLCLCIALLIAWPMVRAAFGVLTPSAMIIPNGPLPKDTIVSDTKVLFGKEFSHNQRRETIR